MMQQTHTTLSNGLQSFADISPDYALAPVGIGSFKEQADKLAEYGRNGDVYVVHAAEGETVVPIEVLEANPKVKELLFGQMREMGLDPEEFIVGNELNSINPTTGMPEFFFKKIFRAVKKAVKKVVSFAKKAAPVILPIAASAFGIPFLGPAFAAGTFGAGFVGGGLGSLAAGKSLKDSFKSGLMSGGISSLMSGITGGLTSKGTFGEGFGRGLQKSVAYSPDAGFDFSLEGFPADVARPGEQWESFKGMLGGEEGAAKSFFTGTPEGYSPEISAVEFVPERANVSKVARRAIPARNLSSSTNISKLSPVGSKINVPVAEQPFKYAEWTPFAKEVTAADVLTANNINPLAATETQLKMATKVAAGANPGMLQTWGPAAAIGAGAAYGLGAFDTPPPPDDPSVEDLPGYSGETGMDMYRRTPGDYQLAQIYTPETAERLGIQFDYDPTQTMFGATGGLASFPRRDGAISGPGTERSDDIPAMLSDGEFVMTSKAVRGAAGAPTGNKELDRRNGAKNMYNMMRNFEMRA
jgi:hypothetical protein